MSKSIALIACSNGLGHVRRLVYLAQDLAEFGANVVLFAPFVSTNRILTSQNISPNFASYDFHTGSSAILFRTGPTENFAWHKQLPNMNLYNIVVSDNLPEILEIRPDAWLSGNFLWHQSLPGISEAYIEKMEKLIHETCPRLLTYGPFSVVQSTETIRTTNCAIPLPQSVGTGILKDALLITCGTGGEVVSEFHEFLDYLIKMGKKPFRTIFVDPIMLRNRQLDAPLFEADFSAQMYGRTLATICRPGLGVISDCMAHQVRLFSVFEPNNLEMLNNANALVKHGVGSTHPECISALECARSYLYDTRMQEEHKLNIEMIVNQNLPNAADVLLSTC